MKRSITLAVFFLAVFATEAAMAQCQCLRACDEEIFVGDELPANAVGVGAWQTWTDDWANVTVELRKVVDGVAIEIGTSVVTNPDVVVGETVLLVPDEGWEVGLEYRLFLAADSEVVDDIACGRGNARSFSSSFTVVDEVVANVSPTLELGQADRAVADWADGDEVCENGLDSLIASVSWELPAEFKQFEPLVQWQIEVDGVATTYRNSDCQIVPPGKSPSGTTSDLLAVACSPWEPAYPTEAARLPGEKSVQIVGRLAGTDVTFATDVVTADLNCEPLPEPTTETDDGCAVAGGKAAAPVALLLLVGLILRTRRRRV